MPITTLPILYSFRRCPYAIRARLALRYAGIAVELREVQLKQKPKPLLDISPKGTVPVLQLPDGKVLQESLDIMYWALTQNNPDNWLRFNAELAGLIQWNDGEFKYFLDRYKYADRYPEFTAQYYRQQAEIFLAVLETKLTQQVYLAGNHFCLLDAAIFPFIRQFAAVDSDWFITANYVQLNQWLNKISNSELFNSVMEKQAFWQPTVELAFH